MSLPIPNLDDRNFEDLMTEALALIPVYDKSWTNYNPSDPGITLLELFSWLSEMTIYRINSVPEENYRRFLELLGIKYLFRWNEIPGNETDLLEYLVETFKVDWVKMAEIEKNDEDSVINIHFDNHFEDQFGVHSENHSILLKLNDEEDKVTIILENGATHGLNVKKDLKIYESVESDIQRGLRSISKRYRAITSDDFEFLANECIESLQEGLAGRAICVNNRDLEYGKHSSDNSNQGHVSVIIVPDIEKSEFSWDNIPGKDNIRLLKFLVQIYGADWIKSAKIERGKDDNTVTVSEVQDTENASTSAKSISLKLNQTKVTLESQFYASYEFISKKEQERLNIYCYTVDGKPSDLLKDQVRKYLDKRKLVTTRLHVVEPDYLNVSLTAWISLKENKLADTVTKNATSIISKYFNPLEGGKEGKGWPIGRNLYKSEIYQLLEGIPGVDHVVGIKIDDSDAESVELKEYQLIELTVDIIEVCDE